MKMELIDMVLQRMMGMLDQTQMQALKMAMVISMEGLEIRKEETELSTEVTDNWEFSRRFLQAMVVAGKAQGTIAQYQMHLRMLFEDVRKPVPEMTDDDLMLHLARQKYQRGLSNRYLNLKRIVFRSFLAGFDERNTYRRILQNFLTRSDMMKRSKNRILMRNGRKYGAAASGRGILRWWMCCTALQPGCPRWQR